MCGSIFRRFFWVAVLLLGCREGKPTLKSGPVTVKPVVPFSMDELEKRTFLYFWETADAQNAQIPDRYPTLTFSSIAATGFGLSAYLVGVERGYINRQEAAQRVLRTLQVLWDLPQGPQISNVGGYNGFFYHFLNLNNVFRYKDVELSTIDTTLLLAGALACQTYFDKNDPIEKNIRELVDKLYRRVNWTWATNNHSLICMGWKPESGFLNDYWKGYNEAMLLYVMALGSPTHPVSPKAWQDWTSTYNWNTFENETHVNFGPLFGHQYSHIYLDFKGIQDDYMASKGIDYFENTRKATLSNYNYCVRNPKEFVGYTKKCWGLTACDGPKDTQMFVGQRKVNFMSYSARGAAADYDVDDGTIAPTAAGGSIPYAPEICLPTLENIWNLYFQNLIGAYGFKDSFNPTYTFGDGNENGWFDIDYLGIDQGPIILQLENYRTGLIWNLMKKNQYIVKGMHTAGFKGGWLDGSAD